MIKVLVAEDDKFLSSAYRVKLSKKGWEVTLVKDGNEVLEHLANNIPNLILLDLIMPDMDGFSVLEKLKENPEWQKIPVIVASNLGQKEDIDKAMNLGAKDFVVKSDTQLEEIVKKIEVYLQ